MAEASQIRIQSWRAGNLETSTDATDLARFVDDRDARTWVDLIDPSEPLVVETARKLGLHPLIAEDIVESNERAKVQLVGEVIHVVAFVLQQETQVVTDEVDLVLGRNFLLSAHGALWDPNAAHQLKMGIGPVLERGPDFLLWALIDSIVDGYFPVFDQLGDAIDAVQDSAIEKPIPATLERLFQLKRELIRIRHVVGPSREVFAQLTSREFEQIAEPNVFYFRDVYDHLIRLNDELDSFRELVAGSLEIYLSTINNNLSTIMKRLTGVTVILAGIGAVGGVFGMSEAANAISGTEGSGFYLVVLVTVISATIGVLLLKRINWL
ncbi:MAG TPA: magnesium transporter CorA family protein [Candidatus Dormibacteraeota bacterium]|nr:magnesium transporter CorA family protein [Candidatus Dormibacteraeota bacterium]